MKTSIKTIFTLLILNTLLSSIGYALENDSVITLNPEKAHADDSKQTIELILTLPEFQTYQTKETWRLKNPQTAEEEPMDLGWLTQPIAFLFEFGLWIIAACILIWLFLYREKWLNIFTYTAPTNIQKTPEVLFGLDVRPESLPENIPQQALALWEKGEHRNALGLLYRGSLIKIIHQLNIEIAESNTEGDCLHLVKTKTSNDFYNYFKTLSNYWQSIAYAHQIPETAAIENLCNTWNQYYGPAQD